MRDKDFEMAEWGFTWDEACNNAEAPLGTVSLSRDGLVLDIPFGLLLGESLASFNTDNPRPVEAEWVYGFSRDGRYLALSEAVIRNSASRMPGGDSQQIGGDSLLVSRTQFNPNSKVECMSLALTGLKEWVGESPLRAKFDMNPLTFRALEYDYENEDSYNKELYSCDDLSLSVYHGFTASSLTVEGMNITHDCRLKLDFAKPIEMSVAADYAGSLSRFLSFCLGFYAEIQAVSFFIEESESSVELYGNFVRGAEPTKRAIREMPVPFKSIEKDISGAIEAWLAAEGEFDSACGMVSSLMADGWDMPIDLRFLAASQALEALSRVDAELESLPQKVYQSHRETILSSITNQETRSWIRDRTPGNTKGQGKLLKELLDRHSDLSDWLIPNRKTFISAHTTARNVYTHRSEGSGSSGGHLTGEALHWHTEAVIVLCQGIIWNKLGVDWKRFTEILQRSHYKSYAIDKAREMYPVKGSV